MMDIKSKAKEFFLQLPFYEYKIPDILEFLLV